jgi:hypothetical protein
MPEELTAGVAIKFAKVDGCAGMSAGGEQGRASRRGGRGRYRGDGGDGISRGGAAAATTTTAPAATAGENYRREKPQDESPDNFCKLRFW